MTIHEDFSDEKAKNGFKLNVTKKKSIMYCIGILLHFVFFRNDKKHAVEKLVVTRVKIIKFGSNLAQVSAQDEIWPRLRPNLGFETLPNLVTPNFGQV